METSENNRKLSSNDRIFMHRISQIATEAAKTAIGELSKYSPAVGFVSRDYRSLDQRRLHEKISEILGSYETKPTMEEIEGNVYDSVYKLVLSGEAFNPAAKKMILRGISNPEETGVVSTYTKNRRGWGIKDRGNDAEINPEENKIYEVINSFAELYEFFKENPEAIQHLPEVAENLQRLEKAGYLKAAADIMTESGVLKRESRKEIANYVSDIANQSSARILEVFGEEVQREIKKSGLEMKLAASVVGIFGAGFLASSFRTTFTGNTVGDGFGLLNGFGLVGLSLIFLAGIFFIFSFNKK